MGQCGAFLQLLVDMVQFGRGGGAPPWTLSPPSLDPSPPSPLRSSNALPHPRPPFSVTRNTVLMPCCPGGGEVSAQENL